MQLEQYLKQSEVTERKFPDGLYLTEDQAELMHAGFGMITEVGEFVDQLKRHIIYGKELDLVNIVEECGDKLWYVAIVLRKLEKAGWSPGEVMAKNIAKLRARFPDGFTQFDALNRNTEAERAILEDEESVENVLAGSNHMAEEDDLETMEGRSRAVEKILEEIDGATLSGDVVLENSQKVHVENCRIWSESLLIDPDDLERLKKIRHEILHSDRTKNLDIPEFLRKGAEENV
jgi:NTP pyrophosphatase (non-canonical NTP hydrolase)